MSRLSYGLHSGQKHHQKERGDPDGAATQTCSGPGPRLQGVPEAVSVLVLVLGAVQVSVLEAVSVLVPVLVFKVQSCSSGSRFLPSPFVFPCRCF